MRYAAVAATALLVGSTLLAVLHGGTERGDASAKARAKYTVIQAFKANVTLYVYPEIAKADGANWNEVGPDNVRSVMLPADGAITLVDGTKVTCGDHVAVAGKTFSQSSAEAPMQVAILSDGTVKQNAVPADAKGVDVFSNSTRLHCVDANVIVRAYQPIDSIKSADFTTERMNYAWWSIKGTATVTLYDGTEVQVGKKVRIGGREFSGTSEKPLTLTIRGHGVQSVEE